MHLLTERPATKNRRTQERELRWGARNTCSLILHTSCKTVRINFRFVAERWVMTFSICTWRCATLALQFVPLSRGVGGRVGAVYKTLTESADARAQAAAAVELNSSIFWVTTQCVVVWNRGFGTTYRSIFKSRDVQQDVLLFHLFNLGHIDP